MEFSDLTLRVSCSKGTYIRSLARDLGTAAGSCAYLSDLTREKVGEFSISRSIHPDKFNPETDLITGRDVFHLLPDFSILDVSPESAALILHGTPFIPIFLQDTGQVPEGFSALFLKDDFLALIETNQGRSRYRMVQGSGM